MKINLTLLNGSVLMSAEKQNQYTIFHKKLESSFSFIILPQTTVLFDFEDYTGNLYSYKKCKQSLTHIKIPEQTLLNFRTNAMSE